MKVLIACEFSGAVRDAFIAQGCSATSCDILPTENPGPHYEGRVEDILNAGWDMMLAFPPCTHLANSGARWFINKKKEQEDALDFIRLLLDAPIKRIAIENPAGVISTRIRKPDQIIHPWQFGHEMSKPTCLWLKDLPPLTPTKIVGRGERHITKSGKSVPVWYNLPDSHRRAKIRSQTFPGIAAAMAEQWAPLLKQNPEPVQLSFMFHP
jgi:hypothetical protein